MAADSDGEQRNNNSSATLKAVVICEGNLHDPDFQTRLDCLVARLTTLVDEPADNGKLTVDKVEPWNSVRVTLSIPKEAAIKLRKLAAEGNNALRALGILSVQLEGDTVLSLRLAGQEIVLRTDNSTAPGPTAGGGTTSGLGELTRILSQQQQQQQQQQAPLQHAPQSLQHSVSHEPMAGPSKATPHIQSKPGLVTATATASPIPAALTPAALVNGPVAVSVESTVFKSPNTICPMDGKLPAHVPNVVDSCEYPFESMTQARVIQRRENTLGMTVTPVVAAGPSAVSVTKPPATPVAPSVNHFVTPCPPAPPPPPPYQVAVGSTTVSTVKGTVQQSVVVSSGVPSSTVGNVAMTSPLLVNLLQNESTIPHSLAAGGSKTGPIIKQELLTSKAPGVSVVGSSSHVTNVNSDNDLSANNGGNHQKTINSSNNPVHPVIASGGSAVPTVTIAPTPATNSSVVVPTPPQTILVNSSNNTSKAAGVVVPMNTTVVASTGPATSASANANLNMMTNSSNMNNTASNNQNVVNAPPSLVTPPMSVPSSSKNVSVQQPRFNLGPSGAAAARPSINPQALRPQAMTVGMVQQQQQQQLRLGQPHSHLNRFPVQQNVPFRQPSAPQMPQPQSNAARWGTPQSMDSATKSSYQEFTRYQMQYNLSQQQLNKLPHPQTGSGADLLGLNNLGDLPDFGKNDLDSLLPTLNSADLEGAFLDLDLEQSLTPTGAGAQVKPERKWKQQFLINPLTGELEETQVEETEENDDDATKNFPEFFSEMSNSLYSDDDTCSTGFSKFTSDVSDTERTSSTADGASSSGLSNTIGGTTGSTSVAKLSKPTKAKREKQKDGTTPAKTKEKKPREKKSSALKQVKTKAKIVSTESGGESPGNQEKIKLRLKLEKPEAISVSLVQPQPMSGISTGIGNSALVGNIKKVQSSQILGAAPSTLNAVGIIPNSSGLNTVAAPLQTSLSATVLSSSSSSTSLATTMGVIGGNTIAQHVQNPNHSMVTLAQQVPNNAMFSGTNNSAGISSNIISSGASSLQMPSPAGEELRVPPLHISLRGKNSVVIKNSRRDRKKSQSGGEEDSDSSSFQLGKKSTIKRSSHSTDGRLTVVMTSEASIRLKLEDSASPGVSAGPSSMPSSPNHQNHVGISGLRVKSNKMEDLNQPLPSTVPLGSDLTGSDQQHKRSASDTIQSPNGLMCPEKRRRLSTGPGGSTDDLSISASSNSAATSINEINEIYKTLISSTASGPIGSTNVGTLPHSSLLAAATSSAKNLKSSSTNNSINNNNAFGKCSSGSNSKNLVKPAQSSPTTSSVSSPGALAAAPNTMSSTQTSKQASFPSTDADNGGKLPGKSDSDASSGVDADGKNNERNNTTGNSNTATVTTTSDSEISVNQRINNTHLHHHNRPPEKAGEFPATSLDQALNQQVAPAIAGASGHLLAQGVRGSPGSQAQGEDSGIESMDALSEKSPHQLTHSPQGNEANKLLQLDSPKEKALAVGDSKESVKPDACGNNNNNSHANLDEYTDIEAALAKMEGLNDIQVTASTERITKLNGDHSTLMKPKHELDILDHNALLKLDSTNLSKILDDIEDDELVMSNSTTVVKRNSTEVSSSDNPAPKKQGSSTMVIKGEETEDWLVKTGKNQQQQQQKREPNDILTSGSNNNLTDKSEMKLDTKQLVLDDCCSNKEVLNLRSECDSKIVECKAVIKSDPEEAFVINIKEEANCGRSNIHSNSSSSIKTLDTKTAGSGLIEKGTSSVAETKDMKVGVPIDSHLEPKPRHEQPPLYSYSSEKARERRSAANSTSSNSSTPTIVEVIDLDDSGRSNDLEPQQQHQSNKPIHSPLSIDIPLHPESAENRVRTRASSKLESPLEPPRQSPSIDSPAAERLKNTISKHVGSVLNAATAVATAGTDRLSPKTLPKAGKRKRQGSESSNQSCVSDDLIPNRAKKPRKAAAAAAAVANAEKQKKIGSSRHMQQRKVTAAAVESAQTNTAASTSVAATPATEDSSDSDEPLIEIAGKFRTSKLTKPSTSSTTTPSTTSSSTYSSSSTTGTSTGSSASSSTTSAVASEKEKTLRNHKSTTGSKSSSGGTQNSVSSTHSNSVGSGGASSASTPHHRANAHSRTGAHSASMPPSNASVSTPHSDEKISTRRSVRMTTSTLSTAAMNSKAKANAAAAAAVTSTPANSGSGTGTLDGHTRETQQTHQHSTGTHHHRNNHVNHQHSSVGVGVGGGVKGSAVILVEGKVSTGAASSAVSTGTDTQSTPTEVRRKTRSAGLDSTGEGRRRRVSRDSK